jgi:hypothetical protein
VDAGTSSTTASWPTDHAGNQEHNSWFFVRGNVAETVNAMEENLLETDEDLAWYKNGSRLFRRHNVVETVQKAAMTVQKMAMEDNLLERDLTEQICALTEEKAAAQSMSASRGQRSCSSPQSSTRPRRRQRRRGSSLV